MSKKYYIGLDVGTDSCGWAVTDTAYSISRFKGTGMWGIRLFDESKTAEERRSFRTVRRRLARRRARLDWLEELFAAEIRKVDPSFFLRLKESNLHISDKNVGSKYTLFAGEYTDKDFHKAYPTVYRLRRTLIESSDPHDVRLVFLALHHIIKYRGHFLFEELEAGEIHDFHLVFETLVQYCADNCEDLDFTTANTAAIEEIIKDNSIGKTVKKDRLAQVYNITRKTNPRLYACLGLLSGRTEKLRDIFPDDALPETEKNSISFSEKYSESEDAYIAALGERFEFIEKLKAVYDWGVLANILQGEKYISVAKDKQFSKHRTDLALLKSYIKKNKPQAYFEVFKQSNPGLKNYVAYSEHTKKNRKTDVLHSTATQGEFCEYLKKLLGECCDSNYTQMFEEIAAGTFCPKQRNAENGVIPMQLHRAELVKILDNAEKYLPFLWEADENGITVKNKIIAIFDYKIPYYVGPLNNHSGKYWVKRTSEKAYPWNIGDVVDFEGCAEAFINNLTSKCTYLTQCDVLPQNSILFSKFKVLNEINSLKIDGTPISVPLKQELFRELFLKRNKVTRKTICQFLAAKNIEYTTLTGIDDEIKSNMKPLRDFEKFTALCAEDKEEIITAITIFGEEKKLLKKRLHEKYGDKLTAQEIGKIAKMNYSGWASLSKEFLTDVYSVCKSNGTGEAYSILDALWHTNYNLMQLIYSEDFDFEKEIARKNSGTPSDSLRKAVERLYVSPKIKRPIYQTLLIVKELVKTQKTAPEKIFLEVARFEGKKERTVSRKKQLDELYKNCKKEYREIAEQLGQIKDDDKLKSDKLFLYFMQCGRCMYTGERIDLEELMSNNSRWDIDHIYPQSKIKDDSIHNNRVLSNKTFNNSVKGSKYPLGADVQARMASHWKYLLEKKLITAEKYNRLICRNALTDEQLSAFINRQIVETQQSTKAIASILQELYPDTEIVYVKAGLVSEFRRKYNLPKSRDVNDLHHAKDAYLNIVVGNVYNVQCTHNRVNFIRGLQSDRRDSYSLNAMYQFDIPGAWDRQSSMATVKRHMAKNNILYTRYSFKQKGHLFDQQLVKKGFGQVPMKADPVYADSSKYGRYQCPTACYFCLCEFTDGGNEEKVRAILPIDLYLEKAYLAAPENYISQVYGVQNVKIIIPCIKYNACLSFNGFRMHLSSKSSGGKALVYKPAVQLVLSAEEEAYIKRISNFLTKNAGKKITSFDKLSSEENVKLYDTLANKLTNSIFAKNFDALRKYVLRGREQFVSLEPEVQCFVIGEILKILHANVMNGNLSDIGGAKKSGAVTTNSRISAIKNIQSVKLINQSVTGLYENEIDLLNI